MSLFVFKLKEVELFGYHGAHDGEKKNGQKFFITLTYFVEEKDFGDDLTKAIDYAKVAMLIEQVFKKKRYNLLETLAQKVLKSLFAAYPQIKRAKITIKKPQAPLPVKAQYAAVSLVKDAGFNF